MAKHEEILKFISNFKFCADEFTHGKCYYGSVILRNRFPDSETWYDRIMNHFATKINGRLYDLAGEITDTENFEPWCMLDDEFLQARIERDCIRFEDPDDD